MNFCKLIKFLAQLTAVLLFSSILTAQTTEQTFDSQQQVFYVTAGTENGFLTGLTAQNFSIYDEGKSQTINVFSSEDSPMSIGILFDTSKTSAQVSTVNVNTVKDVLLKGVKRFIELSNPNNEYFFLSFNNTETLNLDFSQDTKSILKAIQEISDVEAKGTANIHDAVNTGVEKLSKSKYSKRVLLVISNGIDSNSKIKIEDLNKKINNSNLLLYTFGIYEGSFEYEKAILINSNLDELAERTGGFFRYAIWNSTFKEVTDKETRGTFALIANELRSQYKIGFISDGKEKQPTWHGIKFKINLPSKPKGVSNIFIRTRKGYVSNIKQQ